MQRKLENESERERESEREKTERERERERESGRGKDVMNRDGQNMQNNRPKYAHIYATKMAKYARKYANKNLVFRVFKAF